MTGRPAAFSALALASTARVADSAMPGDAVGKAGARMACRRSHGPILPSAVVPRPHLAAVSRAAHPRFDSAPDSTPYTRRRWHSPWFCHAQTL